MKSTEEQKKKRCEQFKKWSKDNPEKNYARQQRSLQKRTQKDIESIINGDDESLLEC